MEETIFRHELQKRTAAIEELLKEYLPAEEGYQKTVIEAMNYSLMAGGKRLRPMLMQETYRMLGGRDDIIEPFMAAIEMIHTYSLVHDDLPAPPSGQAAAFFYRDQPSLRFFRKAPTISARIAATKQTMQAIET